MGIKVGIVGVGAFAQSFIPLFKAHPQVEELVLCDLDAEKLEANVQRYGIAHRSPSLEHLCTTDVEAIVLMTQNDRHAPQAIQALDAGKHVYSAVPSAISMGEMTALFQTVLATGKTYMIGETSAYYPCALYCRERFRRGDFGRIVYGEAEYYHDFDHGLYDVSQWRFGAEWRQRAGSPPMHYPTHSTSLIVSVTGAFMTHVSCQGFVDAHEDGLFDPNANLYRNPFSNESALFKMSDGSICRINEFRRIGHPGTVRMSLHGTEGSYEEQHGSQAWLTKDAKQAETLNDLLHCGEIPASDISGAMANVVSGGTHLSVSAVHPVARLPREFLGLPNGHCGSHQFLVDDFVTACVAGTLPPNNIWDAARYVIPGLIAHESALRGGELLEVPDFGDPP